MMGGIFHVAIGNLHAFEKSKPRHTILMPGREVRQVQDMLCRGAADEPFEQLHHEISLTEISDYFSLPFRFEIVVLGMKPTPDQWMFFAHFVAPLGCRLY